MSAEEVENQDKEMDEEHEAITSTEAATPGKRKVSEEETESDDVENNKRRKSEDMEPSTSHKNVVIKTEKLEAESSTEAAVNSNNIPVKIKDEPVEEESTDSPSTGNSRGPDDAASTSSDSPSVSIKTEPSNDAKVAKVDPSSSMNNYQSSGADNTVTSSSVRPSCRFGIRCYR